MSIRNKGFVLAMEDDEVVDAPVAEVVPETALQVETGVTEVEAEAAEIEEVTAAVEEAEADAETLGEIQEVMAESVEQGEGLDETAAQVAEVAVESICNRLGIRNAKVIPALESFGSKTSRVAATKIAMEGITDKLKEIWKAIVAAFKAGVQKIMDFFARFFQNTEAVKKHAEELIKLAGDKKGLKQKDAKVNVGSAASALSTDGKFSMSGASTIFNNHAALTAANLASMATLEKAVAFVNEMLKNSGKADELQKDFSSVIQELQKQLGSGVQAKEVDGKIVMGPFINNENIIVEVTKSGDSITGLSVTVTNDSKKTDTKEVDALTQDECVSLCNDVKKLMVSTEDYKKQLPKIKAINDAFFKAADSVLTLVSKLSDASDNNDEVKKTINWVRPSLISIRSSNTRMTVLLPSINVRLGKACLTIVSASLKNYVKEEK